MRACLPLALVLVSAVAPRPALAQGTRVIVERFRGPRGSTVRSALIRDFEANGVVVIDGDEERRARRELGYGRSLEPEEVVELARALNANAVIQGIVRRRRRRWRATVRVLNGMDGQELGDTRWTGRTARSLRAVRSTAFDRLSPYLGQARSPGPAQAAVPEGETPWWQRQDAEPTETPPVEEEEEETERWPQTRYDFIRISLLGGTLFRSMETPVRVYAAQRGIGTMDPASELIDETRRYVSGGIGHFELGGRFEIYPGAFDQAQGFPYLGLIIQFTHSAAVSSNGYDRMTDEPVTVPTNQLDLLAALRLRYRTGELRHEPELHLDAGWGMFNFDLGLNELQRVYLDTIIPPMQHGYLHLAAGAEYGIAPPYLTIGAEIGGRIGTNIGGDTRNVWGTLTSPSNGFLIGANARIEIPDLFDTFFIELNIRYFMFVTDFRGQVGCAIPDTCMGFMNPWEDRRLWEVWPITPGGTLDDVVGGPTGSVTDHYVRLQLAIGAGFN